MPECRLGWLPQLPWHEDLRRQWGDRFDGGTSLIVAAVPPGTALGAASALVLGSPGLAEEVDGSPVGAAAAVGPAAVGTAGVAAAVIVAAVRLAALREIRFEDGRS